MENQSFDLAVVGGGIAGLSFACAAAKKGYRTLLFEKDNAACSASIRNFGLVWPIGQPVGQRYELAMKSREIWLQLSREAGFWINQNGSLFVATCEDELEVLNEYCNYNSSNAKILSPSEAANISRPILTKKIKGALYSKHEMTVNSPEVIHSLTTYLRKKKNVTIKSGEFVYEAANGIIRTTAGSWRAERILICSGSVTNALYSNVLKQSSLTACKLQMMKFRYGRGTINIGPTICGGLTLHHYESFSKCPSIENLRKRIRQELPEYVKYGIHVLVAQNNYNHLLIGDSHEYGEAISPFDKAVINKLILKYLEQYFPVKTLELVHSWHGIYMKNPNRVAFVYQADPTTFLITGFGGSGMTLAPAFAESFLSSMNGITEISTHNL